MNGRFVTYYRVSTPKQGVQGLGMEAQQRAVDAYLNGGQWEVLDSFREVESGKRSDRPELSKAIARCKATGAKLLIAKMDRLARDLHFLTGLEKQGVEFVAADMPDANKFTIHILMAVAQQEREAIASRVHEALKSVKDRIAADGHYVTKKGRTIHALGGPQGISEDMREASKAVRMAKANDHATKVKPTITILREGGKTLQQVADHLNTLGVPTSRGAQWTPMAVARVEKRA